MSVTVAIVGRPNVGKSTLFNRLVGKKIALVDDTPGVTRDRREAEGRIGDLTFSLLDTAGYEDVDDGSLEARMRAQTEEAIQLADIVLFMIDARAGVTPMDQHFGKILKKTGKHITLLGNKVESSGTEYGLNEAFKLGFGEPIPVSAEHGLGMADLYYLISDAIDKAEKIAAEEAKDSDTLLGTFDSELVPKTDVDVTDDSPSSWDKTRALNVAIVGRPNAGKSTLINQLVGEERVLTGPEAGITRDSIMVPWEWQGRKVTLVDTAGIRRRSRVQEKLEKLSVSDALRSIQYAEIVVLMLDATVPFEKQDLQLADLVVREGRGLVIALNKWDLIKGKEEKLKELREECARLLPQIRGVPLITLSGLKGRNIAMLMEAIFKIEETWNIRIPTARLNQWLDMTTQQHPPPAVSGKRIRMRYATQVKTRPPSFAVFCSRPEATPKAYERYLVNGLREKFKLDGIPLRLWLRKGDNPYAKKKKRR